METLRERINYLIDKKGVSQYRVSKDTGVSQSVLTRIRSERSPQTALQSDTAKVLASYFEVSSEWLLSGKGSMEQEKENIDLPIRHIPLLPLTAQGGSLLSFADSVRIEDCEQIRSPIDDVDFAIDVRGDSMAPEYPAGSRVLIKRINERAFIEWGKVYVLDTCNGSVIKKILPSEDGDGSKIKCVSISPEYPPFHVAFEDIYGMYRVLLCMSVK